jgi:hypothetical protein
VQHAETARDQLMIKIQRGARKKRVERLADEHSAENVRREPLQRVVTPNEHAVAGLDEPCREEQLKVQLAVDGFSGKKNVDDRHGFAANPGDSIEVRR